MKLFCVSSNVPEFKEGEEYQAYYNGIEYRVIYGQAVAQCNGIYPRESRCARV